MTAAKRIGEQPFALKLLLACGVIGPLLFVAVFLIEGATLPGYSPFRHPVSALSFGDRGWIQIANFIVTGLLLLAFAVGLRHMLPRSKDSARGAELIGLVGLALTGSGIFMMDPLNGYPPGTSLVPEVRSFHGFLHDLFGLVVFVGSPIACFIFRRRFAELGERRWAAYSALTGIAMLLTFVLAGFSFRQILGPSFADVAGLFQRLSLIIGLTWIALLAFRFMGKTPTRVDES